MRNIIFLLSMLLLTAGLAFAQDRPGEVIKVEADTAKGFSYPYYLYVPAALREETAKTRVHSLIVIPNNSGKINDDLAFHEEDVKRKMPQIGAFIGGKLKSVILMPVFPRPATEHLIYTHSLDRDSFTTDQKEFSRFDLQLIAMIKNAQDKLKTDKIKLEKQVLMQGYSASGMFVNRFVFLHPDVVKAAIIGAPGGWAIAPTDRYEGKTLRFPVGTADLKQLSGKKFTLREVRKVPLLLILGDQDTNDAVPVGDAFDKEDSELVIALFGKTPVERWAYSEKMYREQKLNATFKLYKDATHQLNAEMRDDMLAFMTKYAQ